jgi:ferric-dicitrate binding protein FerR (iron transport regulator)
VSELETSAEISDSAERWLARVERGLTDEEQVLFQAWLAGDVRRRGAFLRAEAAMHLIDRACRTAPPATNDSAPRSARRALVAGGLAAAVLGAVGVAWVSTSAPGVTRETVTSVGEIRQVPLEDVSTVLLNTDSSMSVRLEARRRTVRLDRGEGLSRSLRIGPVPLWSRRTWVGSPLWEQPSRFAVIRAASTWWSPRALSKSAAMAAGPLSPDLEQAQGRC